MANRKTQFFWASIAGADPEPVEVCTVDGRRACYTLGCGDPFFLDDPNSPVALGKMERIASAGKYWEYFTTREPKPLDRYPLEAALAGARAAAEKRWAATSHSWRGPR